MRNGFEKLEQVMRRGDELSAIEIQPAAIDRENRSQLAIGTLDFLNDLPVRSIIREAGKENADGNVVAQDKLSPVPDFLPHHDGSETQGFEFCLAEPV